MLAARFSWQTIGAPAVSTLPSAPLRHYLELKRPCHFCCSVHTGMGRGKSFWNQAIVVVLGPPCRAELRWLPLPMPLNRQADAHLMQCCQGYNASVQSWLSMRHCLNERCLPTLLGGFGKTDGATCEPGLFMLQQY